MNPWWLLLIVPVSAFAGFTVSALLGLAACADCRDAIRYREALLQEKSFRTGLKERSSKLPVVG